MSRRWVWLLPVLLAVAQVVTWPGVPLLRGQHPAPAAVAASLAITLAVAAALLWRRTGPVAVTAAVVTALTAGVLGLPDDAVLVIGTADLIVLFSVGARRPARIAFPVGVAVILAQTPVVLHQRTDEIPVGVELALNAIVYLAVLAAGHRHGRWRAERAEAAERFAVAEARRARATETERLRLARDLHDVAAHHVTSIVVSASAAERTRRPELAAAALDHAARTGRSTTDALRRLVEIMRTPPAPDLPSLVASVREAGRPVTLAMPATPLPDTVPAIAREALTNTLRYAAGAPTRVTVEATPTGLTLTVENDAPPLPAATPRIGGGNGITGMRERARAAGGDLTAGPTPSGGWRVHATLPADPLPARTAGLPWSAFVVDTVWIVAALAAPAVTLWDRLGDRSAGQPALMAALIAVHVLPLALRRSRPWTVLAAVTVTTWAWPAAIGAGLLPADTGWIAVAGVGAELLAVHAVGRYGTHRRADWLAPVAGLLPPAVAFAVILTAGPPGPEAPPPWIVTVVVMTVIAALMLVLPVAGAWLAGWLVRRRRAQVTGHEDQRVAWSAYHAELAATAERTRIAHGLGDAVLRHTARMIAAAENAPAEGLGPADTQARLGEVLREARAALTAMRDLLRDLRDAGPPPVAPRPGLDALPGLVARWREHGRDVTLRVDEARRELGEDVALSAYRMVELVLAAGSGPVRIEVDAAGETLVVRVWPAPEDADGEIAAGLRARGGRIDRVPGGIAVELRMGVPSSPSG